MLSTQSPNLFKRALPPVPLWPTIVYSYTLVSSCSHTRDFGTVYPFALLSWPLSISTLGKSFLIPFGSKSIEAYSNMKIGIK